MTRILVLILLLATGVATRAEITPNSLFSNGAVLQQNIEVPIWGTARDGEVVTVAFQNQKVSTTAKDGRWLLRLKPMKAGGPYTMTISGDNTITLTNVLIGEVWVCSGQSNMAFKLNRVTDAAEAIAAANDSHLRFFFVPHEATDTPKFDTGGSWEESASLTASNFSAVAYFFGHDLRKSRKVPVGLIDSSVGGTPAQAWTSRATLEADPELRQILERYAESVKDFKLEAAKRSSTKTAGKKAEKAVKNPETSSQRPCGLYNAMIAPLQPYAIAGAIWYQGEANSSRAEEYQKLFPALIGNWRKAWGQGKFPFLFVQIAPHERMSPEIREAQLLTSQNVPRTAMAVITDAGDEKDIHPKQKEPVGARLALAARAIAYGEKIEYSGPVYDSMKIKSDRAVLSFTHVGNGLVAKGGELKGFTIAGADGNFVEATAKIEGKNVVVSNPNVKKPTAVRYGWTQVPDVNLFNEQDLPASPFRTDMPKK